MVPSAHKQTASEVDWGFFGHRRINRLAVFTLPSELIGFYKKNIEFITEHAVDPDKRRYATKHEAVRHYIDIDHWGTYPFENVPRDWTDALMRYTEISLVDSQGDTVQLFGAGWHQTEGDRLFFEKGPLADRGKELSTSAYRKFFRDEIQSNYYADEWPVSCKALQELLGLELDCVAVFAIDHFSEYGILPYNLLRMQNLLTNAFLEGDVKKILRYSAEFGHYVGDAHVPLHTTENYNGQLTGQDGIHAFWESRLPELYADNDYDFFVGAAEYIADPQSYFWDIVLTSHSYVDSVFAIERHLSETFPRDRQYCFEERLGRMIRTQCEEYAEAYHEALKGQVEARMRASVLSVGSVWYTAWVDAGQPDLDFDLNAALNEQFLKEQEELEQAFQGGDSKGRKHE
ncbi:MAG: hypothetical protein KDC44_22465 [Phaeodactylibacter sp.]|nr:hypothetical protein [Phaeodactylibacter sp.]